MVVRPKSGHAGWLLLTRANLRSTIFSEPDWESGMPVQLEPGMFNQEVFDGPTGQ
jgi:hypothetical protein